MGRCTPPPELQSLLLPWSQYGARWVSSSSRLGSAAAHLSPNHNAVLCSVRTQHTIQLVMMPRLSAWNPVVLLRNHHDDKPGVLGTFHSSIACDYKCSIACGHGHRAKNTSQWCVHMKIESASFSGCCGCYCSMCPHI